jgi:hypothetical protein
VISARRESQVNEIADRPSQLRNYRRVTIPPHSCNFLAT